MRTRSMLHKSKLPDFKDWLVSIGWREEQVKGDYEVLRMTKKNEGVLLVYRRNEVKEHYTTHGTAYRMLNHWFRGDIC